MLFFGIACVWLGVQLQSNKHQQNSTFLTISCVDQADAMKDAAIAPLRSADVDIRRDLGVANDFIESVPNLIIDELNQQLKHVSNAVKKT